MTTLSEMTLSEAWKQCIPYGKSALIIELRLISNQVEALAMAIRGAWRQADKAHRAGNIAARTLHLAKWLALVEEQDDLQHHAARLQQAIRQAKADLLAEGQAN